MSFSGDKKWKKSNKFLATAELHYKEIGDQHPLLEKPQPAELNVRPKKIKDGLVFMMKLSRQT